MPAVSPGVGVPSGLSVPPGVQERVLRRARTGCVPGVYPGLHVPIAWSGSSFAVQRGSVQWVWGHRVLGVPRGVGLPCRLGGSCVL